jgi:hypothetical protein
VGTLLPDCGATAAVKVMLCNGNSWVEDAESVVVVGIVLCADVVDTITVIVRTVEIELPSLPSPP